jgi:Fe-S cluster assembly protein SufD
MFGLFEGKSQDDFQIETVQHHLAQGSTSNLLIKGVFAESSRFDYSGLIRIEKEGQQSHAYQKNQNLLLSPDSFVQSKPFLEILANDVFCTHGSTTGKLNEEQIFYIILTIY